MTMLKFSLDPNKLKEIHKKYERDAELAGGVIDIIFKYTNICLRDDKSKVKINKLEKSFIQSLLSDRVRIGIKNYVSNMADTDIKLLLDDIESVLKKRN